MAVSAPPPPSVEIDDGVIEEARRRQRRRRAGIAGLLAGGAIVAGVLLLAFGGGSRGGQGGGLAAGHGGSLPAAVPGGGGSVPGRQALMRIIGVLRRPQTSADLRALKILPFFHGPAQALGRSRTPDVPLIRFATTTPWGERLYFVPMKAPPGGPRGHSRTNREVRGEALGVFSTQGGGGGGPATAIEAGRSMETEGTGRTFAAGSSETRIILVVPDGVAKVEFFLPRQPQPGQVGQPIYGRSLRVVAPVHDNIAAVQLNRDCCGPTVPMVWLGPGGTVVKRIGNPAAADRVAPTPKPGPQTPLSRTAQRNPATPNRVWITPTTGVPKADYTVHFRVLLNEADYEYKLSGPHCQGLLVKHGAGSGPLNGDPRDLRGRTWTDPLDELPRESWCPGTYHLSVAVLGLARNGDFEYLARPFGTATFTVRP